eukprot:s1076_g11.t1
MGLNGIKWASWVLLPCTKQLETRPHVLSMAGRSRLRQTRHVSRRQTPGAITSEPGQLKACAVRPVWRTSPSQDFKGVGAVLVKGPQRDPTTDRALPRPVVLVVRVAACASSAPKGLEFMYYRYLLLLAVPHCLTMLDICLNPTLHTQASLATKRNVFPYSVVSCFFVHRFVKSRQKKRNPNSLTRVGVLSTLPVIHVRASHGIHWHTPD